MNLFNFCKEKVYKLIEMAPKHPKLIVFDLDYTLWPFYIDTDFQPPFRHSNTGSMIKDHNGQIVNIYPQVPEILENLSKQNVLLAVASRTSEIQGAHQLTTLLGWDKYFKYKEIYPGSKLNHFKKFREYTHIDYSDMLFFDDEERNIRELTKINVTSVLVRNGMSMAVLIDGLSKFNNL